jgi:sugar phosphate isomerase/epimerase
MARITSFATGNIWSWVKSGNKNTLIKFIKNLEVDGVEITFSSKEELYATKFSLENEKWLRGLQYTTIHAPFNLLRNANDDKEVVKQLEIIASLYRRLNAKNVIIHPLDLPKPEILERFKFNVSTENLTKKVRASGNSGKKFRLSVAALQKILKRYPKIGFCLDVAHAYTWSKQETSRLVEAFCGRITQIHFSGTYRKKDHQSLRIVSKDFLDSIEPIWKLKAPLVIEENMIKQGQKFLKEEVRYIRDTFGS